MKEKIIHHIKDKFGRLRHGSRDFQREVRERTIGYVLAGLGVVAGLAWNEAISALIEYLFPLSKNGVLAKFFYAILMTIFVVFVTVYLMKWLKKEEEK